VSRIFRLRPQGFVVVALILVGAAAAGCQKKEAAVETGTEGQPADTAAAAQPAPQPAALAAGHIEVQHVLVGFKGSVPGKAITRTQEEAKKLAYEILERAKKGEDFGNLVQQSTDDQFPGIYRLADNGVTVEQGAEYARGGMVKGFSDAAFALEIGGVGIADFDKQTSPYGWHVIKRLR
jgi:hypothetical protein